MNTLRTAEYVSPKHPDKLCDRIADAILDACLEHDPYTRSAIEVMGGHGIITITGELTTNAYVDMRAIAQRVAGEQYGVQVNVVKQSPEIANGVDTGGAGDQGIMVGYACNENDMMIPQEAYLARSLGEFLYQFFPEDGKTQVTIDVDNSILSIVVSWANVSSLQLNNAVHDWLDGRNAPVLHINPAGDWSVSGFEADTGVTGRKLAVDNYGPRMPIGGGAFSGKDATKVDRSAAYRARKAAVTLLKEKGAQEVYVYLAYAIGKAKPVQATAIIDGVEEVLNTDEYTFTPNGIIESLELRKPQFERLATRGHFTALGYLWNQ